MDTNVQTPFRIPRDGTHTSMALEQMLIMDQLEGAVCGEVDSLFRLAVKTSIRNNTASATIIANIKDMAVDNYEMVCNQLGQSLTDKIIGHE